MKEAIEDFTELVGWKDVFRPWLANHADNAAKEALDALLSGDTSRATRKALEWRIANDFISMVEFKLKAL